MVFHTGSLTGLMFGIAIFLAILFYIWQFVVMIKKLKGKERGLWILLFIGFGLITAIVWLIVGGKKR